MMKDEGKVRQKDQTLSVRMVRMLNGFARCLKDGTFTVTGVPAPSSRSSDFGSTMYLVPPLSW